MLPVYVADDVCEVRRILTGWPSVRDVRGWTTKERGINRCGRHRRWSPVAVRIRHKLVPSTTPVHELFPIGINNDAVNLRRVHRGRSRIADRVSQVGRQIRRGCHRVREPIAIDVQHKSQGRGESGFTGRGTIGKADARPWTNWDIPVGRR